MDEGGKSILEFYVKQKRDMHRRFTQRRVYNGTRMTADLRGLARSFFVVRLESGLTVASACPQFRAAFFRAIDRTGRTSDAESELRKQANHFAHKDPCSIVTSWKLVLHCYKLEASYYNVPAFIRVHPWLNKKLLAPMIWEWL